MNQKKMSIYNIRFSKRFTFYLILSLLFGLLGCSAYAQTADDTISKYRRLFGIGASGGLSTSNYNSIRSYPWMLSTPSNSLPQFFAELYFGNPQKLYVSAAIAAGDYSKTGSFSDSNSSFNSTVSTTIVSVGGKLGRELVHTDERHFINALYTSVGLLYTLSVNSAYFIRNNTSGMDNVAEYDASSMILNIQAMIDLFDINFNKPGAKAKLEFVLITGYSLPLQQFQWMSSSKFPNNTAPSSINIGGAYISLGINYWVYFKRSS